MIDLENRVIHNGLSSSEIICFKNRSKSNFSLDFEALILYQFPFLSQYGVNKAIKLKYEETHPVNEDHMVENDLI